MKIHAQKNLHAKFYLCLPKNHTTNSDGWVIMGSSNISDSGLGLTQPPRYELNVALKDYDDVTFCKEEFDRLWEEAISITAEDIDNSKKKTHLGINPTPYELYIKVLIDSFGDQVEDDFSINLPDGIQELKYQKDAVIQGYQMLLDHNGFFLADVVGLGKTIVATMIAKRFIEANGKNTNVLVIYSPGLESNWKETFKLLWITKKTQFISNGSLSKIIDGKDNYKDKEEFDIVIVDEAHGFRSDTSNRYDDLQRICKSRRCNEGLMKGEQKKVMLLSATPHYSSA
jgi:superfamily II DNA or RNA helicase